MAGGPRPDSKAVNTQRETQVEGPKGKIPSLVSARDVCLAIGLPTVLVLVPCSFLGIVPLGRLADTIEVANFIGTVLTGFVLAAKWRK